MIEFRRIAGFDWDAGNARKHVATHAVDQAEAEQVFFNDPAAVSDGQGLESEQAILRTGQRVASALPGVQQWEGLKLKANQPLTKRP